MNEISLPNTAQPRSEAARAAKPRMGYSLVGLAVLGSAAVALLMLAWFVPSPRLFGPRTACVLAWVLFGVHVVSARKYLSAFDAAIWVPVNMLLNYFGMVLAVELAAGKLDYDPFDLGIPPRLNQSFAVALLTLVCFMLGLHVAGWMRSADRPQPWPASARSIYGPAWALTILGLLMILVGIPIAGPAVLFGAYGDMKVAQKFGTADLRFFGTGLIILQCGFFALLASHDQSRAWVTRTVLIASAAFSLLRISIGDRTGLMTLALGGGWAYTQRVGRVPHWVTVFGFIAAFLVMPVIGEYREFRSVEGTTELPVSELAAANFYDMGSSLIAFSYTLEHIPRNKSYDWGLSVVSQLVDNIPNIGLSPGRYFGLNTLEHNPSKWLVATANPSKWRNFAGGYGYAVGAEWYFNFGMLGVAFGMTFLGFLMGRVRSASRRSPLWLTFASLLSIMMVGLVRNDFGYPFRQLLWPFATLLVFHFLMPSRRMPATPRLRTGSR